VFVEPPAPFEDSLRSHVSEERGAELEERPVDELEMDLGLLELGESSLPESEDALSTDSIDEALTQLPPQRFLSEEGIASESAEATLEPVEDQPKAAPQEKRDPRQRKNQKTQSSKAKRKSKKGKKKGKRK
jgi:hypothetical protein